jgi:hypothetical protein
VTGSNCDKGYCWMSRHCDLGYVERVLCSIGVELWVGVEEGGMLRVEVAHA